MAETPDVTALLEKLRQTEEEKQQAEKAKEEMKGRLDKFTEAKRTDMHKTLSTVMKKYIDKLDTDQEGRREQLQGKKDEFYKGLERLADNTQEDSGIWQVMVCASEMENLRASELEKIRTENEDLRKKLEGRFAEESERIEVGNKRRATDQPETENVSGTLWDDWTLMMRQDN